MMETLISPDLESFKHALVLGRVLKRKDITKDILRDQELVAWHVWPLGCPRRWQKHKRTTVDSRKTLLVCVSD